MTKVTGSRKRLVVQIRIRISRSTKSQKKGARERKRERERGRKGAREEVPLMVEEWEARGGKIETKSKRTKTKPNQTRPGRRLGRASGEAHPFVGSLGTYGLVFFELVFFV